MINVDDAFLKKYFTDNYKHPAGKECCVLYDALRIHFNGEFPTKLISERRPNESEFIFAYRKANYKPKTKIICSRVESSLSKIRRSPDWVIKFAPNENKSIDEAETLEQYINYKFPIFTSLTNWAFAVLLRNILVDVNAVCVVMPLMLDGEEYEYPEPFPFIFNSNQIIDFVDNKYCVLDHTEKCSYTHEGTQYHNGRVVIIVTDMQVMRYEQDNTNGHISLKYFYDHNIGEMPAFKLRGKYKEIRDGMIIWESRISGMVPELDDFVNMSSDLQAQVVQHVFSEKWTWGLNDQCKECEGMGVVNSGTDAGMITCSSCNGTKKIKVSPYNVVNVRPANVNMGEQTAPIPPGGYFSKESVPEMTELLDKLLDKCEHSALSAINMEFLSKVPAAVSGVSKSYDRDEANNTVHAICEDLVSVLDHVCYFINEYRNIIVVPDVNTREGMLPMIAVPESYDLINSTLLVEEMKIARESGMNNFYISKMQIEIAAKKYPNDPLFPKLLECYIELDPFAGQSEDEKLIRLQNEGITIDEYILSSNVKDFVAQALEDDFGFLDKTLKEKRAFVQKYIDVVKNSNSAKAALMPTNFGY